MDAKDLVNLFHRVYDSDPARFDTLPGTSPNWDPVRLVSLYRLKQADDVTHQQMAEQLGFERSTVTRKIQNIDWSSFASRLETLCEMTEEEALQEAAEDKRKDALAKIALKGRNRAIENRAMLAHFYDNLAKNVKPLKPAILPSVLKHNPKRKKNRTPEHMVLLLSDLHVGQEFTKDDTGGLAEYNTDIFKERARNLTKAVLEIRNLHVETRPIDELHILALGDNVQGSNTAGQWGCAYNSTLSIFEQSKLAAYSIGEMMSAWAGAFGRVTFTGVVGNHGRVGEKNMEKISANWDNVVYILIEALMKQHKNVEIDVSQAWWALRDINNLRFALVHGDEMRASINGIKNEEHRIQSLLEKPFNILCAGHFHTHQEVETTNGMILLNGSFVGGDLYSMKKLKCRSRPTQTLIGVHPEHGVTWKYNLNLEFKRD